MDDREQSMNTIRLDKGWLLLDLQGVYRADWDAEVAVSALILSGYGKYALQFQSVHRANSYASRAAETPLLVDDHDVPLSLRHVTRRRAPLRRLSIPCVLCSEKR